MYHSLQAAPAPTVGPSQALLDQRLGVRDGAPNTCGVFTEAISGDSITVPILCGSGQACGVNTDVNVRQCVTATADSDFYSACLDRGISTDYGPNTVYCGEDSAPYCLPLLYNDGYSGFQCGSVSLTGTFHAAANAGITVTAASSGTVAGLSSGSSSTSSPTNAAASLSSSSSSSGTNTTAIIVGVVLAGVLLLVCCVAALFWMRKRQRKGESAETTLHRVPRPPQATSMQWSKLAGYDWDSSSDSLRDLPGPPPNIHEPRHGSWARTYVASTQAGSPKMACPPRF